MSRPDGGTERDTALLGTPRRRLLLAAAALVAAALVALVLVLTGGDDDAGSRAAAAPTAAPDDEPSLDGPEIPAPPVESAPAGQTAPTDERPPNLPAVALDAPAETGDGVTGSLVSVEAIDGTGVGRGNIAGPALRVTVRLTNGTAEAVPLDGVAVELTHGSDAVPASPLDDPSRAPFGGSLEPGASAQGVYVFSVPADDRRIVSVSVGYRAGAPFLVFSGSAP
ncbi:hypothetical protein SAMN05660748_0659 [Blastococcus aggregatus]|uniref:DUF4352 domain-containing protein n=1 Tax=Blastococcus aggregatus TaxID=38502 RepID=A0A285UZB4_9ACTN|nr:hypothetical protein [Blastococcus aggregatus]SOC47169.1 hypothetical protein SAMN05660748_0659 [Blastococcus aggregatus]